MGDSPVITPANVPTSTPTSTSDLRTSSTTTTTTYITGTAGAARTPEYLPFPLDRPSQQSGQGGPGGPPDDPGGGGDSSGGGRGQIPPLPHIGDHQGGYGGSQNNQKGISLATLKSTKQEIDDEIEQVEEILASHDLSDKVEASEIQSINNTRRSSMKNCYENLNRLKRDLIKIIDKSGGEEVEADAVLNSAVDTTRKITAWLLQLSKCMMSRQLDLKNYSSLKTPPLKLERFVGYEARLDIFQFLDQFDILVGKSIPQYRVRELSV